MLIVLSIPYIGTSLIIQGFPALLPFVREEFALSRTQVGYYSTCFYLSAAVLAVFTGSVVDRLGTKRGLLFGIGCMGFTSLLFSLSPSYSVLLLLAFIAGLGFSIVTPSVNKGVMIQTPHEKRAFSMGIMQSGIGLGGFFGASLLPLLGENFGWRIAIFIAGIFALLLGLLVHRLYRESSGYNSSLGHQENPREQPPSIKDNLLFFLAKKQFLLTCLFGAVLAGSSVGAIIPHLPVFLFENLEMTRATAGLGLGVFQLGGITGRPILGWFSDRFLQGDRRKTIFLIGLAAGIMFLIFGLFINNPQLNVVTVYIFSFVLGCFAFGWLGVYLITIGEFAGDARTGSATGLTMLFLRTGIMTAPPIFGFIADGKGYDYSWLLFGTAIILVSFFYYLSTSRDGIRN